MTFFSRLSFISIIMGVVVFTASPIKANEITPIPVEEVETLSPATGTLDDLSELPSKSVSDWSWSNREVLEINTPEQSSGLYQIDTQSSQTNPFVNLLNVENDWKKLNRGDVEPPKASIPLTKF